MSISSLSQIRELPRPLVQAVLLLAVTAAMGTQAVRADDAGKGKVDAAKPIRTFSGHEHQVVSVAFSPNGKTLASGGADNRIRLWEAATGQQIGILAGHEKYVHSVAFSPDGKTLASASEDLTVRLWDVPTGNQIRALTGHEHAIWTVAFSPDGKTVASASEDQTVQLWDVATGKPIRAFMEHENQNISVAFSPDGRTMASGSYDKTVRLWAAATGRQICVLSGHKKAVCSVAFSPDGRTVVSGSMDSTVRLWEASTGKQIRILSESEDGHWALSVAFSPDGRTVAAVDGGKIQLWDAASGKKLCTLGNEPSQHILWGIAFSPDGKTVASGSSDKTIQLWATAPRSKASQRPPLTADQLPTSWAELASADVPAAHAAVWKLTASPRLAVPFIQKRLRPAAAPTSATALIADLDSDQYAVRETASRELEKLGEPVGGALRGRLRPPLPSLEVRRRIGRVLEKITVKELSADDLRSIRSIQVLEYIGTPESRQVLEKLANGAPGYRRTDDARAALKRLSVSAAMGTEAIGAGDEGKGKADAGKPIRTFGGHEGPVYAVAFSPDGKIVASGSWDKSIRLWEVATGKQIRTLSGHGASVLSVAFSPDGKTVASGISDGTIRAWDATTSKQVRALPGHSNRILSADFSPNSKFLALSSANGVRLWETATGRQIHPLVAPRPGYWVLSAAISPDNKIVASSGKDKTIRLWKAATGEPFRALSGHEGAVSSVTFSPDGRTIASGGGDNTVRLWETATGQQIRAFSGSGLSFQFLSVAFSPDGKTVAAASIDKKIRIWDMATAKQLHLFRHERILWSVAFAPDGKNLAAGSEDNTIRLWETVPCKSSLCSPLTADQLPASWAELASADVPAAHTALWNLTASPRLAVPFIQEHLPAAVVPPTVPTLIADLDSDQYAVREKASRELEKLGETVAEALRGQLQSPLPSLEVRRRIERVLKKIAANKLSTEQLRSLRAIQILEYIGTPESRQVLEKLAQGAPGYRRTDDARAALQRLNKETP